MAKKNKIIIAALITVMVGGGGYVLISGIRNTSKNMAMMTSSYSVIEAGENDLSKTISASGSVIGNGTVDITTKLTCEVSEVKVSLGDHVKKGDVLCVFDDTQLQDSYDELKKQISTADKKTDSTHEKNARDLKNAKAKKETSVARAQRAVNKAISERDKAYADYNKKVDEYNSHLNDPPAEDGMGYDLETASAALDQLYEGLSAYDDAVTTAQDAYTDTVEQCDEAIQAIQDLIDAEEFESTDESEKQLKELKEQLDSCTITAPQDGVITALNVNEGTIPSSASLMTIVNTDKTVIELTLRETDITRIEEGMAAEVTSKVLPDEKLPAKITRIVNVLSAGDAMDAAAGTASDGGYKVEVTLDSPNDTLLIGMSASVEITLTDTGKKLSVPYSGIVEEDDKQYVYVATPDKDSGKKGPKTYTVKKTEITTGVESDFYTEVVSGDIKDGDLIVENPQGDEISQPVEDGGRIIVNE